jgi:soluble lytic murein transglycosylase
MLAEIGAKDTFKGFVVSLAETLPSGAEAALLVDLVRGYGDQDLSMKVVRTAAQHGFILPERGYPVRTPPTVAGAPETAFILGITRQESGFDPHVRSGAGAEGMMQLMPGTAAILARKLGYSYGGGRLDDPDFNMQLGSAYLGQLVDQFSGSYVMAAAAYNAGPGRPTEWSTYSGDPRATSTDPSDFIECIPFSETRNYVMRVLEATQVYRARLAGGSAPLTLAADLKRGGFNGYGYTPGPAQLPPVAAGAPVAGGNAGLADNAAPARP